MILPVADFPRHRQVYTFYTKVLDTHKVQSAPTQLLDTNATEKTHMVTNKP